MLDLARELVKFAYGFDPYEWWDNYDTLEDAVTETCRMLYSKPHRKGIASALKCIVEWHDDDETASEAVKLYRAVMAL